MNSMRPSKVLEKLRSGKTVCCVKFNLVDPRVVEIAAACGVDCIWLDMEHTACDWNDIENQIRAAKIYNVDTMVRVARGSYSDYVRPLELDAAGLMVPHIMNLKDAENVVRTTRFHPIGRRPVDGGNADGMYTMINFKEYIKEANEKRFIVFQIEDPEPLDELDKIAQLDGYDMLFFGPADFSHGIGHPAEFDNPFLVETKRKIPQIAKKYGKFAGTVGNLQNLQELIDLGYNFINLGADVVGLTKYYSEIADTFRKICKYEK